MTEVEMLGDMLKASIVTTCKKANLSKLAGCERYC